MKHDEVDELPMFDFERLVKLMRLDKQYTNNVKTNPNRT